MSSIVSTETEPVCVLSNGASAFRAAPQKHALVLEHCLDSRRGGRMMPQLSESYLYCCSFVVEI